MMEEPTIPTPIKEKLKEVEVELPQETNNQPEAEEIEVVKVATAPVDEEKVETIRASILSQYEEGEAFPVRKFDGLIDSLQRTRASLHRQEENRTAASIDIDRFSGAIARLTSALEQKKFDEAEVVNALSLLAERIEEGEGEKRKMPRDVNIAIDDYRRVVANLRAIDDEAGSLRALFQENETILKPLRRLQDSAQEQALQILRLRDRLKRL